MKKILIGMVTLMFVSGVTSFASDKIEKAKKAETKKECKTACKDKKDCKDLKDCSKACKPSTCGK